MDQNNARIFREMQAADQIRADMKENIKEGALKNLNRDAFGALEQSGLKGALDDIYRRCFENAWFQKDIFDGRFHWDTKGQDNEAQQKLGGQYDTRQQFYGWDRQNDAREQQHGHERNRGEDLER